MRDVVRTTPADPRVSPDILGLADKHQETSEGDAGVDITHRQIEHRHALEVHALGDRPRHECEQAKKSELDEIDEGQQRRAKRSGLHDVRKQLDGDVRIAPGDHRATDEHDPHQTVARDLLGPGEAVVEHVAREELQKDDEGERPEEHEGNPIFRIVLDHDLSVFRLNETLLALRRLFLAHDSPPPRPQPSCSRPQARHDGFFAPAYFNACSASYSACDQPAPALGSLCSGTATLRKASRSTSTTVLPSLRNSSASLSSDARI